MKKNILVTINNMNIINPPLVEHQARLKYIDRAKAVAMLCVVFGHINLFDYYGIQSFNTCKVFGITALFQMPLFIFLSGLVVKIKIRKIDEIILMVYHRFRALLMPLIIIGGIYTFWIKNEKILHFLENNEKYGYWYLWCLFVFYIIHYLYEYVSSKIKNMKYNMLFDALWFLVMSVAFIFLANTYHRCSSLSITYLAYLYPYFFLGIMTTKYGISNRIFTNDFIYTIAIVVCMGFVVSRSFGINYPFAFQSLAVSMIVIIIAVLYRLENVNNYILRFLDFIGRNTLDIYIFHYFLIAGFHNLWIGHWNANTHYSVVGEIFMAGIPAVAFSVISIYIGRIIRASSILSKIIFNI